MQTHTFISHSAEHAVAQIKNRLGPNAIVLDVRKVKRGLLRKEKYEITATVDSAESEAERLADLRAEIRDLHRSVAAVSQRNSIAQALLVESGILPIHAESIVARTQLESGGLAEQISALRHTLRAGWREVATKPYRVHVFVGTPGSGKSTTLCKWLAQHILGENRGGAVYQLDAHIANLSPQPRYFTEILGAHFTRGAERVFDSEVLFVDLPGVTAGDAKGLEATRKVLAEFPGACVHLVLNGAYDVSLLLDQIAFFARVGLHDLIVTHLDEQKNWGKLWNLVLGTDFGIRFLSLGQNVPGGLHRATAEELLSRQFGGKAQ
jgi:flagellar biosynthesis protein FlhF